MRTCKGKRYTEQLSSSELRNLKDWNHVSDKSTDLANLNEFLSAGKLWHQNIFAISNSGEGHTELSRSSKVSVFWKLLQQGVPGCPEQTEGRVENPEGVFSGFFRSG